MSPVIRYVKTVSRVVVNVNECKKTKTSERVTWQGGTWENSLRWMVRIPCLYIGSRTTDFEWRNAEIGGRGSMNERETTVTQRWMNIRSTTVGWGRRFTVGQQRRNRRERDEWTLSNSYSAGSGSKTQSEKNELEATVTQKVGQQQWENKMNGVNFMNERRTTVTQDVSQQQWTGDVEIVIGSGSMNVGVTSFCERGWPIFPYM